MKILLIQTAFIGDVILVTPLIHRLKEVYPLAMLDVMVKPQCVGILENNGSINKIICFDKRSQSLNTFWKFIQRVKFEKYDISISPHSSFRSGLIPFLAKIPKRIGFKRYFQQIFLTHKIVHPKNIHKRLKNLKLLDLLIHTNLTQQSYADSFLNSTKTHLYPSLQNYQKASLLLSSMTQNQKNIIMCPGSVWYTKRWNLQNYICLTQKLIANNFNIILSGSPSENEIINEILDAVQCEKKQLTSIAGTFNILDSAALFKKSDLVICNDSGALHIANAMQIPVFAFFGPTVKNFGYYPFNKNDFVFEANLDCRPCSSHGGKKCPKKHFNCMNLISVDFVFQKVLEFLSN